MNKNKIALYISLLFVLTAGCSKWDSYTSLIQADIVYPGTVSNLQARPGNGRVQLTWTPSSDTRIARYVVYWNNRADSLVLNADTHSTTDTVKCLVTGLSEYSYAFTIFSYDAKGNRSVPTELSNVRSYGSTYRSALLNRIVNQVSYANGKVSIDWKVPDTVNVTTRIIYQQTGGSNGTVYLSPDSNNIAITNWSLGSTIYYQSSFKPVSNALDTFSVSFYDSIKITNLTLDKSMWKQVMLPNDIAANGYGTKLSNIWDGKPGGFDNGTGVYHAVGSDPLPQHFTIDLGKIYNKLTQFEEWGRQDCGCHNVTAMEVWGIADTTGAATLLSSDNAGWKAESVSKGWTLLTEVNRSDDGKAGIKVDLIKNIPPIRFVRIRVMKTLDNSRESHMSEISFRYNP